MSCDTYKLFDPADMTTYEVYQMLIGVVGPRPIALASTCNEDGSANLAPYSFFNAFSSDPPLLVFSSNLRLQDDSKKDTLQNIERSGEVVINMVSHAMIRQMTITSIEYPAGVGEFEKSGLTPIPSTKVAAYRVAESPASMECTVQQIVPLGDHGGAGHLIISKIVAFHIKENVLGDKDRIDPYQMDLMGRLGRSNYVRVQGDAIHSYYQPILKEVIGFDGLPTHIRESQLLTGNEIAQLATSEITFDHTEVRDKYANDPVVAQILAQEDPHTKLHLYIRELLDKEYLQTARELAYLLAV